MCTVVCMGHMRLVGWLLFCKIRDVPVLIAILLVTHGDIQRKVLYALRDHHELSRQGVFVGDLPDCVGVIIA